MAAHGKTHVYLGSSNQNYDDSVIAICVTLLRGTVGKQAMG
jgi:hypothetical protein